MLAAEDRIDHPLKKFLILSRSDAVQAGKPSKIFTAQ